MEKCRRCGTCCRKGGPAIHADDRELVEKGRIPLTRLYTIREGELAMDNVRGEIFTVRADIVRLKSVKGAATCVFYDGIAEGCEIYDDRPLECRTLKCWDTRDIERVYGKDRLSRKDLLEKKPDFLELVEYHGGKCDYGAIRQLIDVCVSGEDERALEKLGQILAFDDQLREMAVEKGLCDVDALDFLFGRPVRKVLRGMGLKVVRKRGGYRVCPVEPGVRAKD